MSRHAERGKVDGGDRQRAVHIKDPVRALREIDVHKMVYSN